MKARRILHHSASPAIVALMVASATPGLAGSAGGITSLSAPVVTVTGGQVEGVRDLNGGASFKGIPFAAPPVGELRWRAPEAVPPWNGVRKADTYASSCAQVDSGWNRLAVSNSSEDCLYLNIWAPASTGKKRLPVMMWIHGGANNGGSAIGNNAIEPPFDGKSLSRQDVVVVTINYRLGVFGFVGHPEARAESPHDASGNYGILDQIAALQWIRQNIASFGGDPKNVTVFGQSAGAQDTSILISSPLTRGLMHKAIVESGSPMIGDRKLLSPDQTAHLGTLLAQALDGPEGAGSLAYLRSLSTAQILTGATKFRDILAREKLRIDVSMDGYAVAENPGSIYLQKRQRLIPIIVGSNAQDAPGYRPSPETTAHEIEAKIRSRIAQVYDKFPDLQAKALRSYGLNGGNFQSFSPYGPVDQQLAVDYSFRCGGTAVARWQAASAPTYRYEFTAGTSAHPPVHSAELDFVFGYLRDQANVPTLQELSSQMQRYWANFARTGNPNGPDLPQWPQYDAKGSYLELSNSGPLLKSEIRNGLCDIYADKVDRELTEK